MTVTESNSSGSVSGLSCATVEAPFGYPVDPYEIRSKVVTTPFNVIAETAYLLSSKIFNYILPGGKNDPVTDSVKKTDNLPQLWSDLKRTNLQGSVPDVYSLDVTSGCGSILLGYLKKEDAEDPGLTVLGSTAALQNITSFLNSSGKSITHLPISFQIATLDYDFNKGVFSSNFAKTLEAAKQLQVPVFVSSSPVEAQHFATLSIVLSRMGIASIHIFDGLQSTRVSQTIDGLVDSEHLNTLQRNLLDSLQSSGISRIRTTEKIKLAFSRFNEIMGTNYNHFQLYGGHRKYVSTLFVVSSTDEVATSLFSQVSRFSSSAACVVIKSPQPFDTAEFNKLIRSRNVKQIVVVSQTLGNSDPVKLSVQASLFVQGNFETKVISASNSHDHEFLPEDFERIVLKFTGAEVQLSSSGKSFRFVFEDNYGHLAIPSTLTFGLSMIPGMKVKYRPRYDNRIDSGVFVADVQAGEDHTGRFDLVIFQNFKILNKFDFSSQLKDNAKIVVLNSVDTKFDPNKASKSALSEDTKRLLAERSINIDVLDLNSIGRDVSTKSLTSPIAINVAFWTFAYPDFEVTPMVNKIWNSYGPTNELLPPIVLNLVNKVRKYGFKQIPYSIDWLKVKPEEPKQKKKSKHDAKLGAIATVVAASRYSAITDTSFDKNPREKFVEITAPATESRLQLSKQLIFKEAYGTKSVLKPDEKTKTFTITVKENKRVTPVDYGRNIFEIEFDISGTGLKYNIGESLGIYGRNDEQQVNEFIKMYGLDPDETVRSAFGEKNDEVEVRTVRQLLTENLDLLGKPNKQFYQLLMNYATDEEEKSILRHLGNPAGADLLKEYQEEGFYNYVDIFKKFKSARPPVQDLVTMIAPLKRREYSIASSQKLHPDEIHLLIVEVDWKDKQGRARHGQCSSYLSNLKVGDTIVVAVKPSLMKLPELTTQPVIMAGLGTGLAPFKAFVEERRYQKEHGQDIGEIYLYLGSRHKKQEYLYGEFWEAYMKQDILTYLGAAFSRDQSYKVYIQDKIRENLDELTDLICNKNGHFYLCGPTWPVPDVTACLEDVYRNEAKKTGMDSDPAKDVEKMKEEGRFVLEVY